MFVVPNPYRVLMPVTVRFEMQEQTSTSNLSESAAKYSQCQAFHATQKKATRLHSPNTGQRDISQNTINMQHHPVA